MTRFSTVEIRDLLLAWLAVSLAFGIALRSQAQSIQTMIWVSLLTVGIGFIVHELAHKFVAQHYKKYAEFQANYPMLGIALVISLAGIVIAAPGAVFISGFVSRKESGIIAAAGPIANVILALVFLPLFFLLQVGPILTHLLGFGFIINAWLALFNLLPFGMFDGAKIISWNKLAYGTLVVVSVILVFLSGIIMGV